MHISYSISYYILAATQIQIVNIAQNVVVFARSCNSSSSVYIHLREIADVSNTVTEPQEYRVHVPEGYDAWFTHADSSLRRASLRPSSLSFSLSRARVAETTVQVLLRETTGGCTGGASPTSPILYDNPQVFNRYSIAVITLRDIFNMAEETTTATSISPEDEQIISTPEMHDR